MNEALGKVTQALEAAKSIPCKTHTSLYIYRYNLCMTNRAQSERERTKRFCSNTKNDD